MFHASDNLGVHVSGDITLITSITGFIRHTPPGLESLDTLLVITLSTGFSQTGVVG